MKLQTRILAGYLASSLLILGLGAAILFTINTVNPVVDELERRIGKTVVTVNQATIWNALRKLGWRRPIEGYGQLLRSMG